MLQKGFTLLEVLIVVLVVSIIALIVLRSYSLFSAKVSLNGDVGKIVSLIQKAQSNTLSGRGGLQYGVHFESKKAVLFQGTTYSSGAATNEIFPLSANISITIISLAGGGSNVVFEKLSGVTNQPGSITVSSKTGGTTTSIISVSNNGVVTTQ